MRTWPALKKTLLRASMSVVSPNHGIDHRRGCARGDRAGPHRNPPWRICSTPGVLERIAGAIGSGAIAVPIAATFPVERIREAVTTQAERHVHGKIVIAL
ncbi:hypothetical protein ADK55_12245 [Streptomyces sp. WM4235]|nr:hypothetical protein ADK55_12245 [Streptomyces sp. WM4235]